MHISQEVLAIMCCPQCRRGELRLGAGRFARLRCEVCHTEYPFVEGIPDLIPPSLQPEPGSYRTDTFHSLIADVYDLMAAPMSVAVWRCSPLKYVDAENRALGRANGGVFVRSPVSTGLGLGSLLADYHDITMIGVDRSWEMLQRAQRRLADAPRPVHLIRADYRALPFRTGSVRAIQSYNGLQSFDDRIATLQEFLRCLEPEAGFLSGSALIRGQKDMADVFLNRLERWGVYPMLRSAEFLLKELETVLGNRLQYETHGAVMFYAYQKGPQDQAVERGPRKAPPPLDAQPPRPPSGSAASVDPSTLQST